MEIEELARNFPDGTLPEFLVRFLRWRNDRFERTGVNDFVDYLGFDLTPFDNAPYVRLWFGEEKADAASRFAIFASEKSGGMFGYWLYEGRNLDDAPLVVLDSEGSEYSTVMANSLTEFFQLFSAFDPEFQSSPEDTERYQAVQNEYRQWMVEDCRVPVLENIEQANELRDAAQRSHPSLEAWIESP